MAPIVGTDGQGRTTFTFNFTGAVENWTVPSNVKKIKIEAWGAQGGFANGGKGGYAWGELPVTPGEILNIYVGGKGGNGKNTGNSASAGIGGWNGGGNGGAYTSSTAYYGGGGGGGASDVRRGGTALANRILVAAGGGGAGGGSTGTNGGNGGVGGGLTGGSGTDANSPSGTVGTGGTQAAAGTPGSGGGLGQGANAGSYGGGGGGGGYYGGGGANGSVWCGGGGGSSYVGSLANSGTTAGVRSGDGLIVITVIETNNPPTISLTSPTDNQTLSEGSTYTLAGSASDPDNGNAVTVKYAINGGTARNITSAISDGTTPIPFSKTLTFQNGRLYDGETDVSGPLAENTTYTVSVYAVDDQGGTSTAITRSFTVILNRPPTINLDPYNANQTGVSELEALTFAGTVTDPENDTVSLTVAVNGGAPVTLKSGVASGTSFAFSIPVSSLAFGANTVVFTATDAKGASTTKTLTVNKAGNLAPIKTAVVRYVITPPLGNTAEIAAWVQREDGDLNVDAAASIVGSADPETYVTLTKNASVPLGDGTIIEDEFVGTVAQPGAKVALRLTFTRENTSSTAAVKKIMGGIG